MTIFRCHFSFLACCPAAWLLVTALAAGLTSARAAMAAPWPSFRGPRACGVMAGPATAVSWDVPSGRHVAWRTRVEGLGHACPVIWGDDVYLISAVRESGQASLKTGLYGDIAPVEDAVSIRWMLYCFDKRTGARRWQRRVHEGVPRIKRHTKSSHANSTPATDGRYLVSFFGSEALVCFDMEGREVWRKDLGMLDSGFFRMPTAQWGFGSSPTIHDGRVIVQCDVQGQSFLACFQLADGASLWRTDRDEVPTWGTPTVVVRDGRSQVIVNGFKQIGGYDLEDGRALWWLAGGGDIPVPTPVVDGDMVFITNAHGGMSPIYAIHLDAGGDLSHVPGGATGPHVAWSKRTGGNYMQTPIVMGEHLHTCSDGGVYGSYTLSSGKRVARHRLSVKSGYTASPVASAEGIYYTAETGEVVVVTTDGKGTELAVNRLGESCLASPAISDGRLFFRTRHHLVAISAPE